MSNYTALFYMGLIIYPYSNSGGGLANLSQ